MIGMREDGDGSMNNQGGCREGERSEKDNGEGENYRVIKTRHEVVFQASTRVTLAKTSHNGGYNSHNW